MSLIKATDLTIQYGRTPALSQVNFSIDAGETVTIVGPNGSGKSTLIRALLGIVKPAHGSVVQRPGLRIGYVPQKLIFDAAMPLTAARFLSLPKPASAAQTANAITRTGAQGLENRQMANLSGGQLQRVLLARALLGAPQLLILDEPTQGLDQRGVAAFYRLINDIRLEQGCAVLLVSHDLHVVMSTSDRVICLNRHICCEGTPQVVASAPAYRELFGLGTGGELALYRHEHDHHHDHTAKRGAQ